MGRQHRWRAFWSAMPGALQASQGLAWPLGPRARYAPTVTSERLPSLTVEVGSSCVPTTLLPLVPAPLLHCAGPTSRCHAETA